MDVWAVYWGGMRVGVYLCMCLCVRVEGLIVVCVFVHLSARVGFPFEISRIDSKEQAKERSGNHPCNVILGFVSERFTDGTINNFYERET